MIRNLGSGPPAARSHVVRDPPSIKTCAPAPRLRHDLGLREMPEALHLVAERDDQDSNLRASSATGIGACVSLELSWPPAGAPSLRLLRSPAPACREFDWAGRQRRRRRPGTAFPPGSCRRPGASPSSSDHLGTATLATRPAAFTGSVARGSRQISCAARRLVVSPAQPGGTRREVPGSDDLRAGDQ
jgi:hypothetical protein